MAALDAERWLAAQEGHEAHRARRAERLSQRACSRTASLGSPAMPYFICPNCKERSIDHDGLEGLTQQAVSCARCGFGFLFELMDDYYPAPTTGFVVCDSDGRILAAGRGVFELTGYTEADLLGPEVIGGAGPTGFEDGQGPGRALARVGRAPARRAPGAAHARRHAQEGRRATSSPRTTRTAACSSASRPS